MTTKRALRKEVKRLEVAVSQQIDACTEHRKHHDVVRDKALQEARDVKQRMQDAEKVVTIQAEGLKAEQFGRGQAIERSKELSSELATANAELSKLRRQLSSIREKFQPPHTALYPDLGKYGLAKPGGGMMTVNPSFSTAK